jgi:hypothetical protein
MDTTINQKSIEKFTELPKRLDRIDAEIWQNDSRELKSLAKNIVDNNRRFAFEIVHAWLEKYGQVMIDKDFHGYIYTPAELEAMFKKHSKTKKANQS